MTDLRILDTCVVSGFLKPNAAQASPILFRRVNEVVAGQGVCISTITAFELLRGLRVMELQGKGRRKIARTRMFLETATVLGLDGRGLQLAVEIYAKGKTAEPALTISDGDLLIVATAVRNGRVLMTTDSRLCDRLRDLGMGDAFEFCPPD